jgi:hypothetical protein
MNFLPFTKYLHSSSQSHKLSNKHRFKYVNWKDKNVPQEAVCEFSLPPLPDFQNKRAWRKGKAGTTLTFSYIKISMKNFSILIG